MDTNKNNVDTRDSDSLDLSLLWSIFKRRWYIIILVAILVGFGAGAFASFTYVPKYSASISFLIQVSDSGTNQYQNTNYSDMIVHTYEVAFKHNREFCQTLNELAGTEETLGYTADDVASMMSCEQIIQNTPTLKVTFTCPDRIAAYNLATALQIRANDELQQRFQNLQAVDVFNGPIEPTSPVTSDPFVKMFAVGFLAGAVLMYAIFLLIAMTDIVIHGESSMEAFSEYPILGVVPTFSGGRNSGKRKKKSR